MSPIPCLFHCLLAREPYPDESGDTQDVNAAIIKILQTIEFRSNVVLPVSAGNDLKPILSDSITRFSPYLSNIAPLTENGRTAVAAATSRLSLLSALFGDRRFCDEVHARAKLDWPVEIFSRVPLIKAPKTTSSELIVSIIMPVYNTPPDILSEAIQSVQNQSHQYWELCICDDASTSAGTRYTLDRFRGSDPRIKILRSEINLHIAGASNAAAELATGEFLGFLDHDDQLVPHALKSMVAAAVQAQSADVLYSDEDKLEADGRLGEPYLKPNWSPEHLTSVAYVLHFMMIRKSLFFEIGGFRSAYTGAQDYDLTLRATVRARKVVHVPKVLYHWRKIAGSAAAEVDAKPMALINAEAAVSNFVRSQEPAAQAGAGLFKGSFRIKWPVTPDRPVTLLMLTNSIRREVEGRGEILLVENAVDSIFAKSTFRNFKIIVVDNGKMPTNTRTKLTAWGARIEDYSYDEPFNFCDKINSAFRLVETEDVVILNDDIEVISPDWIEALVAYSRRPNIGAVGARLLYPNGRNQHVGMVMGVHGACAHAFHNQPADEVGYCGYTHLTRNYSAVTGAVLATRMSLVRWIGGFDRGLGIDYNDVDFCLRLGSQGFRSVYTPFATLHHFEGYTLRRAEAAAPETEIFRSRWGTYIEADPYYNPALPRNRTDFSVSTW